MRPDQTLSVQNIEERHHVQLYKSRHRQRICRFGVILSICMQADHLGLRPLRRPLFPHCFCPYCSGYPFPRVVDDPHRRALRSFRHNRVGCAALGLE